MAAAGSFTVQFDGLSELRRALDRGQKGLGRGVPVALRDVSRLDASVVRSTAPSRSGRLRGSARPFVKRDVAGVRITATRSSEKYTDYPYPRRLNFDPRSPHAGFVDRIAEQAAPRVVERMTYVLDDVAEQFGGA